MDFNNRVPDKTAVINSLWKENKKQSMKKKTTFCSLPPSYFTPASQAKKLAQNVSYNDGIERSKKVQNIISGFRNNNGN